MKRFTEVTEPHLPSFDAYVEQLKGIWERRHLTNGGPLVTELEKRLKDHLNCDPGILCVANGGLAIQILIHALELGGEVITTPYSYVATTSCLLWEQCTPVFADIDEKSLCIDPAKVEALINPSTTAVLATHVFGNPCDVIELQRICANHNVALIFDAAHAFGVRHRGRSILDFGDASIMSLHATKVIHSVEGGFVASKNPAVAERVEWMRRFGHAGHSDYHGVGINAKMSELHAAMAHCVLDEAEQIFKTRHEIAKLYQDGIAQMDGLRLAFDLAPDTEWNACYFPVLFESEDQLESAKAALERADYGTRRYFYPALDRCGLPGAPMNSCPNAHRIAPRVLCLPLSSRMRVEQADEVLEILSGQL